MQKLFTLRLRLAAVVVMVVAAFGAMSWSNLDGIRTQLLESKHQQLETVVQLARSLVDAEIAKAEAGEIGTAQAKATAAQLISELRYGGKNYLWVNDVDGNLVAHPHRADQIGSSMLDLQDRAGTFIYRAFVRAAQSGDGFVDYVGRRPGGDSMDAPKLAYLELVEPWGWIIGSGFYVDDVDAAFRAAAVRELSIAAAVILAIGLMSMTTAWAVSRGLDRLGAAMAALAGGRTNVEVPMIARQDELGAMARTVEVFKANAIETERLRQERAATAERMATALEGAVGHTVEQIGNMEGQLQSTVVTLAEAARTNRDEAAAVTQGAADASCSVQTVAAAGEELTGAINEIGRQAATTATNAAAAVQGAQTADRQMRSLEDSAQRIGEVVTLIEAIASQTNLLALNATIEAARAGEAGRGFAVVATEVKTLAAETGKATARIEEQISAMQELTGGTARAIADVAQVVGEIDGAAGAIAAAVEEQGAAAAAIQHSLSQAADGAERVRRGIGAVDEASGRSAAMLPDLETLASRLSDETRTLSDGLDGYLKSVRAG
ncbi:MAG: cache domain-containing protein [Pseudomonadota bacterium]